MKHLNRTGLLWLCVSFATILLWPVAARAQNEDALRSFFEGRRIRVKIDMPGSSEGVDLYPERDRLLDFKQYGDRLKKYGVSIRSGESSIVTLVKVKKDIVEFQIGGGGFGTAGDDSSYSVGLSSVAKSNRERDLEALVKSEKDAGRKKTLQRELDDVRRQRELENNRIAAERMQVEEQRKARIAEQRLRGGSRFNLRYSRVPGDLSPEEVVEALSEYVEFPGDAPAPIAGARMPQSSAKGPFKGMLRASAEEAFGPPVETSARREGALSVITAVFLSGEQRIVAEFVEDVLIRYSIVSR